MKQVIDSPITIKKIEFIFKNFSQKKSPDGFTGEFYETFKGELTWILHNSFQNIEEEKIVPN